MACPFIAAIVGTSMSSTARKGSYIAKARSWGMRGSSRSALPGAPAERKSAPAQKLLPLPVMTTARSARSSRARAIASRKPPSTSGVMLLRFSGRLSVIVAM